MTKTFCLEENILSMAKKFTSATYKSLKITFPDEKGYFHSKEVIFMDSCTVEINFLAMDKIFCPRQNEFRRRQKNFVRYKNYLSKTKYFVHG